MNTIYLSNEIKESQYMFASADLEQNSFQTTLFDNSSSEMGAEIGGCLGSAGTLGCATGSFGSFGTYGCYGK